MLRIRVALVWLGCALPVWAAEITWDHLRPPASASPRDVTRYVRDLRRVVEADGERAAGDGAAGGAALVARTRAALERVLPQHLGTVLQECTPERSESIVLHVPAPEGLRAVAATKEPLRGPRPLFTRIVLGHIARLPEIPPDQRQALFARCADFPELVLGLESRPWLAEIDAHLSPQLMKQLDRSTGWHGTLGFWVAVLLNRDTAPARRSLETLLVEGEVRTRLEVYELVARRGQVPARELDAWVAKAWRQYVVESSRGHRAPFAAVAARHGVADAVVELAEYVRKFWEPTPPERASAALLAVVDGTFADAKQAADWVIAHARKLRFDGTKRTFGVPAPG